MALSSFKSNIATGTAVLSISAEIVLAKCIPECALFWVQLSVVAFVVLLLLLLFLIKKGDYILQSFLVVLHNHAGSVAGVFMIIYVLIEVHLAGTSFHEYLAGKEPEWTVPLTYTGFLFFPFLLQAFAIEDKKKKVDEEKRKVMVTALGLNDAATLQEFKKHNFVRGDILKAVNRDSWNWTSVDDAFRMYPNLTKVVFLIDIKVRDQLKAYSDANKGEDILHTYLQARSTELGRTLVKQEVYLDDVNDFDTMYKSAKPAIEGELAKYNDEEIIFNISASTSTVTATLVFLSVKGKRGFCYLEQQDKGIPARLKEFNVNAYDLKELWKEITEIL